MPGTTLGRPFLPAGRLVGRCAELGAGQVDLVRLGVERHRPRARLGLERLHHRQLVRRVLMRDGHRAVAAGAEGELGAAVELGRVHALPDGHAGHDLAGRRCPSSP